MKILALDTSGITCSVALVEDNSVIAEFNLNTGTTHSQNLVPMIKELQTYTNIALTDIDAFACATGPGSFTGLRIGIATIKGFALSLNKPVIGISSLEGLANNIPFLDGMICSVLDAKNDNVYAALFKYKPNLTQISENLAISFPILLERLKQENSKILLVGDGSTAYHDRFLSELGENCVFAPFHQNNQKAVSIAKAALERARENNFTTFHELTPLYLKKSQAERMLDENEKNCHL